MQRREGISGHFRPSRGNLSEQSRFTGVWITNHSAVSDCAKLQHEMALFAFSAFGEFARGAIPRALEVNISFAAGAAFAKNKLLTFPRKIDNRLGRCLLPFVSRPPYRPDRNFDDFLRRRSSVHFLPHSVATAFR